MQNRRTAKVLYFFSRSHGTLESFRDRLLCSARKKLTTREPKDYRLRLESKIPLSN